ncbi:MAG: YfhO family protein [Candidatus Aureabacteria bacterium]|nr:YfhO family protein [Candidatus Auribacterota bacterium]
MNGEVRMQWQGAGHLSDRGGHFRRWRDAGCLLLLALLTLFFLKDGLFARSPVVIADPMVIDLTHHVYPWKLFGFSSLQRGEIPLWNPYLFCGAPFIASWSSAMFYPLNALFLFLPVHTSINWSFALHIFLTGMFTYLFMRLVGVAEFGSLIASISFMFSGTVILRLFAGHLSIVCALTWFPAQILAVEAGLRFKRLSCFILGGLAVGMQWLAGHPQYPLYSLMALVVYFVLRLAIRVSGSEKGFALRACVFLLVMLAAGFALGAVQILPSHEFAQHSYRGQKFDYAGAVANSLPLENLVTFLVPDAFGNFKDVFCWGQCYLWEGSVYMGILPLALALLSLFGRRSRYVYIFGLMAVLSFLIAMGRFTPLFTLLYDYVPGFKMARGSARMLVVTVFSLSALAGFGVNALQDGSPPQRKLFLRAFCGAAAACVVLVALYYAGIAGGAGDATVWKALLHYRKSTDSAYWKILDDPSFVRSAYEMFRLGVLRLIALTGVTALILLLAARRERNLGMMKALMVAVVALDLWSYGGPFIHTEPISACWWPKSAMDFLSKDSSLFRIFRDYWVSALGVNQNMNNRIASVDGYEADFVSVFKEFVDAVGINQENAARVLSDARASRIAAMMNMKYVILPAGKMVGSPLCVLKFDGEGFWGYERTEVLPRAFVVHGAKVIPEPAAVLAFLEVGDFRPREQVLLSDAPGSRLPEYGAASDREEATIVRYSPNEVVVKSTLEEPGILFLSDVYYPGWTVRIDGAPGRILRANYAFRAVFLEKGAHEVRFRYLPQSFIEGALLSLISLAMVAAWIAYGWGRGKGRRAAPYEMRGKDGADAVA